MDTFSTIYDEEQKAALAASAKATAEEQKKMDAENAQRKTDRAVSRQRVKNWEALQSLPEEERARLHDERSKARRDAHASGKAFDSFKDMTERTSDSQMRQRLQRGISRDTARTAGYSSTRNAPSASK